MDSDTVISTNFAGPIDLSGGNLLNVEQAAHYLNLSVSFLRKAVAGNRIRYVRVGTRTLFRSVDLQEWITEHIVLTSAEVRDRARSIAVNTKFRKGKA